jgi:hypothetical protein
VDLPTVSPEIAKAAAAAFHAVGDYLQTGKPMPGYLVALLSEVAMAVTGFLVVRKATKKDDESNKDKVD